MYVGYTAFGVFRNSNSLENFICLETTYFECSLFNSQTKHLGLKRSASKCCGAFRGPKATAANASHQTNP